LRLGDLTLDPKVLIAFARVVCKLKIVFADFRSFHSFTACDRPLLSIHSVLRYSMLQRRFWLLGLMLLTVLIVLLWGRHLWLFPLPIAALHPPLMTTTVAERDATMATLVDVRGDRLNAHAVPLFFLELC
jgi:hypothetical protein